MIDLDMVRNDVKGILNQSFSINLKCMRTDKLIKCHFNANSKVIYENGAVGTEITALITLEDAKNLRLKDEIEILGARYEITKSVLESQVLKRLFLREI